jgi:hypothetical protein
MALFDRSNGLPTCFMSPTCKSINAPKIFAFLTRPADGTRLQSISASTSLANSRAWSRYGNISVAFRRIGRIWTSQRPGANCRMLDIGSRHFHHESITPTRRTLTKSVVFSDGRKCDGDVVSLWNFSK